MTEETKAHPAAAFNVEDWLQDAHMPEQSALVYKRADVIGELTALRSRIEVAREAAAVAETSAGETSELTTLTEQYQALVDTFAGSQLTIYVKALSPDQKRALRAAHDERVKDLTPVQQNEEYGYDLLSAAITAVRPFEGERVAVTWDHATVRSMEQAIGATQMSQVLQAYQAAQNLLPAVDADFLRKPSGEEAGQG